MFKMNVSIDDPEQWSTTGLCCHYYHMADQKRMWSESLAAAASSRKSIKLRNLDLDLPNMVDEASPRGSEDVVPALASDGQKRTSKRGSLLVSCPSIIIDNSPETPAVALDDPDESTTTEVSPLKELLLVKKPDKDKVRALIVSFDDKSRRKWLNQVLDTTPPPMPSPLFQSAAAAQWDLVEMLIELRVDVTATYVGTSVLKGWLKPNMSLVESVKNRKGRFVGTMLGDKLEAIEHKLVKAATNQQQGEETVAATASDQPDCPSPGYLHRQRTKSVNIKCSRGMMLHTQGHPNSKYELSGDITVSTHNHMIAALDQNNGNEYAVKALNKSLGASDKDPEAEVWSQISILRKLEHPHLIRMFETFEDETHVFMVFELCSGGDLFDHLVQRNSFSECVAMRLSYQMGSAIRHLHQLQICHRDIRPEAFLVSDNRQTEQLNLKLMDFSTAKEFSDTPMTTKICSIHYVAPEILASDHGYNEKVDNWSLGVCIYIMIAGRPPFDAERNWDVLQAVKSGHFTFEPERVWSDVSTEAKDLVKSLMTKDPKQRLDIHQVMDLPRFVRAETEGALISPSGDNPGASGFLDSLVELRTAFSNLVEKIDDDQIFDLRMLLRDFDTHGSGNVDISDCREDLIGMFSDDENMDEIVNVLQNTALQGKLNYAMFIATMTDKRRHIRREAARHVFNTFCRERKGVASKTDIKQALQAEQKYQRDCGPISQKELEAVWEEMQEVFISFDDADKELNFEDFFRLLPRANSNIYMGL